MASSELFSVADSPERADRNLIEELEDDGLKDAMDSLGQLALDADHRSAARYPGIKQWTFATVAVALVPLFFGIGSLVSAVLTVQ